MALFTEPSMGYFCAIRQQRLNIHFVNNYIFLKAFVVGTLFLILKFATPVSAQSLPPDTLTSKVEQKEQVASWSLTSAFHSASLYFFSGSVDQSNPSFDALFIYDRKTWGAFFYKSLDLLDHTTGVNYAMLGVHKIFLVGTKWSFVPTLGGELNQNYTPADKGSDFIFDLAISYKISVHLTISNDALFQNLIITKDYNWTNRLKLSYQQQDFNVSALLWQRSRAFNNAGYLSTGLDISYNIIKFSHTSNIFVGASNIYMLQSDASRANGFMFNLGLNLGN